MSVVATGLTVVLAKAAVALMGAEPKAPALGQSYLWIVPLAFAFASLSGDLSLPLSQRAEESAYPAGVLGCSVSHCVQAAAHA